MNTIPDFSNIPPLYGTEQIPTANKIIYRKWIHPFAPGFIWLMTEYDPASQIAFGWVCLSDPACAEWGYFYLPELIENGAMVDRSFKPCRLGDTLSSA